jgi:hypothetical protein
MLISEKISAASGARAFVPLASSPFSWFEGGLKKWELRKYGRQYTERHIWVGKRVELRHGYRSNRSLWGTVSDTVSASSVSDFFSRVDYRTVIPVATSLGEACRIAEEILNIPENTESHLFGFRIELDK